MKQRVHLLAVLVFLLTAPEGFAGLGDTNADLVFTPLPPCRVVDTRLPGSPITSATERFFRIAGDQGFLTQGGTVGGCGVPFGTAAALINFVAVAPQGAGNLRGAAYPNPFPVTGSIVNYQQLVPQLNIANGLVFPICGLQTCDTDIRIIANGAATHLVADVLGYFKRFPKEETITGISAGTGLQGGGTSGAVTLSVAPGGVGTSHLSATGSTGGQVLTSNGSGVEWALPPQGDISAVNAGVGLTGGGDSGSVTLDANLARGGGTSGSAETIARSDHKHYVRTIIVSPIPGSPEASGEALIAAMNSITDAAADNRYLIKIEPGEYDLANSSLSMQPHVDVEGSGRVATRIFNDGDDVAATVFARSESELRSLTVDMRSPVVDAAAIESTSGVLLRDVAVRAFSSASDGTLYGLRILAPGPISSPYSTITDSVIGVLTFNSSEAAFGVWANTYVLITDSRINVSTDDGVATGIYAAPYHSAEVINSTIDASSNPGGLGNTYGIQVHGGVSVTNSRVSGFGGPQRYGISHIGDSGGIITVTRSDIIGGSRTIFMASASSTVYVSGSALIGGVVEAPGTVKCVSTWDESLNLLPATCN